MSTEEAVVYKGMRDGDLEALWRARWGDVPARPMIDVFVDNPLKCELVRRQLLGLGNKDRVFGWMLDPNWRLVGETRR